MTGWLLPGRRESADSRGQRPPPAPGRAAPGGRKWGGERGAAASQLSLLSPEGMSADFLKSDPGRPSAARPSPGPAPPGTPGGASGLTWGAGVKSSSAYPQRPRGAEKEGVLEAIKLTFSPGVLRPNPSCLSFSICKQAWEVIFYTGRRQSPLPPNTVSRGPSWPHLFQPSSCLSLPC